MRSLLIILALCFATVVAEAQDDDSGKSKKELKAEKKAAKKAARQAESAEKVARINALLEGKEWVLEANRVYNRQGRPLQMDRTINFVSIQQEDGVFQLSFNQIVGWNGVGGITMDGKVTKYELKQPKKAGQGATLRARVNSSPRSIDIDVRVTGGNVEATIRASSAAGPQRIKFTGELVHPSESTAYKGWSRF